MPEEPTWLEPTEDVAKIEKKTPFMPPEPLYLIMLYRSDMTGYMFCLHKDGYSAFANAWGENTKISLKLADKSVLGVDIKGFEFFNANKTKVSDIAAIEANNKGHVYGFDPEWRDSTDE